MRSCAHKVPTVYTLRLKNDQVHKAEKVIKNNLTIISKPHAHAHTMKKTSAVSKRLVKNFKRSCAHKTPMVNVDGGTDRWTDEQTDGNLQA